MCCGAPRASAAGVLSGSRNLRRWCAAGLPEPPTVGLTDRARLGRGLPPLAGTLRLRRHALGHHPAAVGGPLAAPSRGPPANEMLMRLQ